MFFNEKSNNILNEEIIYDYFNYIKLDTDKESIFRLLSPLLQIFFGIPGSKNFKARIHKNMKLKKLDEIEKIFLSFVKEKKILIT